MKRIFLMVALFCPLLIPSMAYACSCATGDPPFEFNRAKAVFIGHMLGGTEKLSVKGQDGLAYSIEAGEVRFTVEEVFKGDVAGEVAIEIAGMNGTSCGPYGLIRGGRYIVYAYGSEKNKKTLHSGVCTRTAPVSASYAKEDLDFLRNLPPARSARIKKGQKKGRIHRSTFTVKETCFERQSKKHQACSV
jgi:hypothetical protein